MRTWRVIVVVIVVAAVAVILATAYLEAEGRITLPWMPDRELSAGRWQMMPRARIAEAGPYVAAAAGLLLQFMVGVLVVHVAPERMRRLADTMTTGWRQVLRYLVTGLLLAAALGVVATLSAFYVHMLPLPFVLGAVFFLAALVGGGALAFALGRGLLRQAGWADGSPLFALLLGTLPLYAAIRLPYLAPVMIGLLALIGAGAALSTRFGGRRTWSLDPLREVNER